MKLIKRNILILMVIINYIHLHSQEGVWINEYTVNTENNTKSDSASNMLMLKIEKDSLFTFNPGKEEWKGKLTMGFPYLKEGNKLSIPNVGLSFEYINDKKLLFKHEKEILHFKKIKAVKHNINKLKKLISKNIFTCELIDQKKDTISFRFDRDSPKYKFKNIGVMLIKLNEYNTLLLADFKGENIYEIDTFNSKGFSIIENSKRGNRKINFKAIKIKNLKDYITKENNMVLEIK